MLQLYVDLNAGTQQNAPVDAKQLKLIDFFFCLVGRAFQCSVGMRQEYKNTRPETFSLVWGQYRMGLYTHSHQSRTGLARTSLFLCLFVSASLSSCLVRDRQIRESLIRELVGHQSRTRLQRSKALSRTRKSHTNTSLQMQHSFCVRQALKGSKQAHIPNC